MANFHLAQTSVFLCHVRQEYNRDVDHPPTLLKFPLKIARAPVDLGRIGGIMPQMIDLLNMSTVLVPGFEEKLNKRFCVHKPTANGLPPEARNARALIPGSSGADAALIEQLPKLEIISTVGVGYDRVDVSFATARGIVVTNTPDVLTDDVADLAIALMIMVSRRLAVGDRLVRGGGWKTKDPVFGPAVTQKKLGILGLGRIGKAIAVRATAMKMAIAYTNRRKVDTAYRFVPDLVTLASESDFLVVAASAGPDARHIVNRAVLEALGPTGILVNVARGVMVDEAALIDMLQTGGLGGAGLDVFEHEPHVPEALLKLENVVLTPHVGSGTVETRMAMGQMALDNLSAHFDGKPLVSEVLESKTARAAR